MSHWRGDPKSAKKCQILYEWPLNEWNKDDEGWMKVALLCAYRHAKAECKRSFYHKWKQKHCKLRTFTLKGSSVTFCVFAYVCAKERVIVCVALHNHKKEPEHKFKSLGHADCQKSNLEKASVLKRHKSQGQNRHSLMTSYLNKHLWNVVNKTDTFYLKEILEQK